MASTKEDKIVREVALAVRARREELGLTQAELAAKLGVTKARVSHMEAGENFKLTTLSKLASTLGGSVQVTFA